MADEAKMHGYWWIHSEKDEYWAGLRIAVFIMSGDVELFSILNEPPDRQGLRVWEDVSQREGWRKLEKIEPPAGFRYRN